MSNYFEYKDKLIVHPGYYIKEIIDELGLTQEDFAKRLDTTPKNLSLLIRGEQSLSVDIAYKLSQMLGTTMNYWLNLQNAYDTQMAQIKAEEDLELERRIFSYLSYSYFTDNFDLPAEDTDKDKQIKKVREFLNLSSLSLLTKRDISTPLRESAEDTSEKDIVLSNTMVQLAVNQALKVSPPKYDKRKLSTSIDYVINSRKGDDLQYAELQDILFESGVVLEATPNIKGAKVESASKKLGGKVLLMINDKIVSTKGFLSALTKEVKNVLNSDYGMTLKQR